MRDEPKFTATDKSSVTSNTSLKGNAENSGVFRLNPLPCTVAKVVPVAPYLRYGSDRLEEPLMFEFQLDIEDDDSGGSWGMIFKLGASGTVITGVFL